MADEPVVLDIDMDRRCSRCGHTGTAPNGLCLKCITASLAASIRGQGR